MANVRTEKRDVAWNYIGTVFSMASNFALLPFLLAYLSDDELGLWYVFVAVANFTLLFEFGFNPTFSRNIVYCMSGARRLLKEGCDFGSVQEGVDWHLLKCLFKASRFIYAVIAVVALVAVSTLGSVYVGYLTRDLPGVSHWVAWGIFCLSMFLNLYYFYILTYLRGLGDIASENRAKTFARLAQLLISAALLVAGGGLVGAAVGFFAYGLLLRVFAMRSFRRHHEVQVGLASDRSEPTRQEVRDVLSTVSFIAWRDGLVQMASYLSSQGSSIVCSLFLSLSQTGMYSLLLQLAMAVCGFACAFVRSFLPMFQSAYAEGDRLLLRQIVERGISMLWILLLFGVGGVLLFVFPLIPVFKPGVELDPLIFVALCFYLGLYNQHSVFCNFIISTNRIPYLLAYVLSAPIGMALSVACIVLLGWGAWGLVAGQAVAQLAYNNWRWPQFVLKELELDYPVAMTQGFRYWLKWARGHIGTLSKTIRRSL